MTKLTVKELVDIGVIKSGHFLLSCGRHSDRFVECSKLSSNPKLFRSITYDIAQSIIDSNTTFDIIISPAVGGILLGYELARQLGVPFIYTEKQDKSHYLPDFFDIDGKQVLIIDDVITSGRTVESLCSLVDIHGGTISAIGCIVNKESISLGYPIYSYLDLSFKSQYPDKCTSCKSSPL